MEGKKWVESDIQSTVVDEIIQKYSYPRSIALYLAARGIGIDEVDEFINGSLKGLSNPFRFPKMKEAVIRLWQAIEKNEKILIHGDYDTDGVTSSALLSWVLKKNGAIVSTFLPHRFNDGYGFTPESLRKAIEDAGGDCKVLVTVDCGVNSLEAVEEANRLGVDVIITDHHEPGEGAPDAIAVLNPKVHDSLDDLHVLAGVGVTFKLCHAFIEYGKRFNIGGFATDLREVMDLVALGTIADIVPLVGENRTLVKYGIRVLKQQRRPGIRALAERAKIQTKLKASDVTFKLAPRINAAGRLGNANIALGLLEATSIVDAYKYANELESLNIKRQQTETEIYAQAKSQIEAIPDLESKYSILAAGEGWHQGVIGIVASRLARDYNRPAIVLTISDGEAHGSGRSIGNLNLVNVLMESESLLERFGGHPMAVGLGLDQANIEEFRARFEKSVKFFLNDDDLIDKLNYDGEIGIADLNEEYFELLEALSPFGHSNPSPVYRFRGVTPIKVAQAGQRHSRGVIRDCRGDAINFIMFNVEAKDLPETEWDIIAIPQLNNHFGEPKPQLQIIDLKSMLY
jgi:single-stranded-DNA-specific exonuclease